MAHLISSKSSRLKRGSGDVRVGREANHRSKKSRKNSDARRLERFRQSFFQGALPDLPKIKGYHVCWLTTTNPRDPIHGRMRLGYTPIKPHEIPGYETLKLTSGEHAGCIGVNEMVAFKLPLHLYQAYMKEAHHTQPAIEEGKLRVAEELQERFAAEGYSKKKVRITEANGTALLGRTRKPPRFGEDIGEE